MGPILALMATLLLIWFISVDIKKAKEYGNATRVQGTVCENRGEQQVASYGRTSLLFQRKVTYYEYLVKYNSELGIRIQTVLLKEKNLNIGDTVEVRYAKRGNDVQLVDESVKNRLRELALGAVGAIVLVVLIFIFT